MNTKVQFGVGVAALLSIVVASSDALGERGDYTSLKEQTDERLRLMERNSTRIDPVADTADRARRKVDKHLDNQTRRKRLLEALENAEISQKRMNTPDSSGYTLLHYAVMYKWYEVVSELMRQGADPNVRDITGRTAHDWAADRKMKRSLRIRPRPRK